MAGERPRLNLKPRDPDAAAKAEADRQAKIHNNPFGAAKPREAVLASRTGKTEEEILKDAIKHERLRLRLDAQQLEEKQALEALVDEVKEQIGKESDEGKRKVLGTLLAEREGAVDTLMDKFAHVALEAAQRGEVQRPSERRAAQGQAGYGGDSGGYGGGGGGGGKYGGRGGSYEEAGRDGGYGGDSRGGYGGGRGGGGGYRGGRDGGGGGGFRGNYRDAAEGGREGGDDARGGDRYGGGGRGGYGRDAPARAGSGDAGFWDGDRGGSKNYGGDRGGRGGRGGGGGRYEEEYLPGMPGVRVESGTPARFDKDDFWPTGGGGGGGGGGNFGGQDRF